MRKISTLVVSVLCMMMPVGAEAQVPTAFVSKGLRIFRRSHIR